MLGNGVGGNSQYFPNIYQKGENLKGNPIFDRRDCTWERTWRIAVLLAKMVTVKNGRGERTMEETRKKKQEAYENYVKQKTPVHNVYLNMLKAFVTGGAICVVGQWINNYCIQLGLSKEVSGSWTSLLLVLASVILTGFGLYPKMAKWGGAGTLVPITGFANSVAAPAIEYKKEGQVFGIGCKIFTIAGPVILYGIFVSWLLGLVYYLLTKVGIVL